MKLRLRISETLRRGRKVSGGVLRAVHLDDETAPPEVLLAVRAGSGPGRAVKRNLARRRLRECLRRVAPRPGRWVVRCDLPLVAAKPGAPKRPLVPEFKALLASWERICERSR